MRTHRHLMTAMLATLLLVGAGCDRSGPPPLRNAEGTVKVVASFYPLAHFATKVGGEFATVTNITPPGTEPHEYEPTPQQVAAMHEADLFIFNGGDLDVWAARLAPSLAAKGVRILEMAPLIETHLPPPDAEDEDMLYDPHFWLDPVLAQTQVEAITEELALLDGTRADEFTMNGALYVDELATLDAEFKAGLASCELETAVTSHAAFAYLAKRYGFIQLPISGLSPEEEPSAGDMAEIAKTARAAKVKYIFFETLVSPQLAKTVAQEIGAQTLVFNPLEGLTQEEVAAGKDYASVMRENLANLRTALQCR